MMSGEASMNSMWKVWTDATTEEKAARVGQRVLNALGRQATVTVAPYEKTGGHVVQFALRVEATSWAEGVLAALGLAQRAGRSWTLLGSVLDELDAVSSDATVAGVTMLACLALRTDEPDAPPT